MPPIVAYFNGPQGWLIIALIVIVLVGGAGIPRLARGLGDGIREFKRTTRVEPRVYVFWGQDNQPERKRDEVNWGDVVVVLAAIVVVATCIWILLA